MGLHELTLRNFRLFSEFTFEPDPDAVTVFLSPNGTGKTSVLEAVNALATASSFRTNAASDMIRNRETTAEVHGVMFQRERRVQVDLTLTRGVRNTTKRMLVNGQRPRSRAELSEALPLTVFTPEGVDVVRGGPENRRSYLTNLLTDVEPLTGEIIERFNRVLSQRNALLRALEGNRPSLTQQSELELWTSDFCQVSNELLLRRYALLDQLEPLVTRYYQDLAENTNAVGVRYERSWTQSLPEALSASFNDDRFRGYTTVGPHRDDVELSLEGRDARRQASQGEQRSLALALRLAGHELVRQQRGVDPLLLLDDVFSELDPVRSNRLLGLLPVGQTLVTTASPLPGALSPSAVIDLTQVMS
ncbi:MAG TPA: DNA replication and repair protein RecF [Acidimicrobiales bacterium]|nr:DNA replication and repair protein RecF [Acidimicrobiales bacterium]